MLDKLWIFANSPLGISLISGLILWLLSLLHRKKPSWEKLLLDYRGIIFDAVRMAEKAIPDDSPSKSAQRIDMALKYLLKIEPALKKKRSSDLQRALQQAHKEKSSGSTTKTDFEGSEALSE